MPFSYQTGERIRKGDRVLFHGEPGEIEFLVDARVGDPAMDWYVDEFGGGVMVIEPKSCRTFLRQPEDSEDLVFVSRREAEELPLS